MKYIIISGFGIVYDFSELGFSSFKYQYSNKITLINKMKNHKHIILKNKKINPDLNYKIVPIEYEINDYIKFT